MDAAATETPSQPEPHPRDLVCEAAGAEMLAFANDWRTRHGLSHAEQCYLFCILQARLAQAAAVAERHVERIV
jgi:hypothetical protein